MTTKQEKKQDKKKLLILLLCIIAAFSILSGGLFAYWAGTVNNPPNYTEPHNGAVTIGKAGEVNTEIKVSSFTNSDKLLVPVGRVGISVGGAAKNTDVYEQTLNFTWVDSTNAVAKSDDIQGTLTITPQAVLQGAGVSADLIQIEATPATSDIVLNGDAVPVKIKITLKEPADAQQYTDVINKLTDVTINAKVVKK